MRALVQRVSSGSVSVNQQVISSIDSGLCVLIGLTHTDTIEHCEYVANRLLTMKLFDNVSAQPWKCNVQHMEYSILCVSQFTLYAQTNKSKPDFHRAMSTQSALSLYTQFIELLKSKYSADKIYDGQFGAMMNVNICNDGPVTIMIDSDHINNKLHNNHNINDVVTDNHLDNHK